MTPEALDFIYGLVPAKSYGLREVQTLFEQEGDNVELSFYNTRTPLSIFNPIIIMN